MPIDDSSWWRDSVVVAAAIAVLASAVEVLWRRRAGAWRRNWCQGAWIAVLLLTVGQFAGVHDLAAGWLSRTVPSEAPVSAIAAAEQQRSTGATLEATVVSGADPAGVPGTAPVEDEEDSAARLAEWSARPHPECPGDGSASRSAPLPREPRDHPADALVGAATDVQAWAGVLLWIWIVGTLWCWQRYAAAHLAARRLLRRSAVMDAASWSRWSEALVGWRRTPPILRCSPHLRLPCVVGWLAPEIVLPADFERRFSPRQQAAILAHELAHVAGRDPCWRGVAELVAACWWWNPLAWRLRTRLLQACEDAADEATTALPWGPEMLAESLVAAGRGIAAPAAAMGGGGLQSSLARRVTRLLELQNQTERKPRRGPSRRACAILAWMTASSMIVGAAWARPQADFPSQEHLSMQYLSARWRNSLSAIIACAAFTPWTLAQEEPRGDQPRREGVAQERDREPARERGDEGRDRPRFSDLDRPREAATEARVEAPQFNSRVPQERGSISPEAREALAKRVQELILAGRMDEAMRAMMEARRGALAPGPRDRADAPRPEFRLRDGEAPRERAAAPRSLGGDRELAGRVERLQDEMAELRAELRNITGLLTRLRAMAGDQRGDREERAEREEREEKEEREEGRTGR